MNLNRLVASATRAVTPPLTATLRVSTGATTGTAGQRTPTYAPDVTVTADVQAIGAGDLRQLDALNIQGVERVAYLQGNVEGLNRAQRKGGDLLIITAPSSDAGTWLVTVVHETWGGPGWCKVGLTLQREAAA